MLEENHIKSNLLAAVDRLETVHELSRDADFEVFLMRFCFSDSVAYAEGAIGAEAESKRSRKDPKDAPDRFVDSL